MNPHSTTETFVALRAEIANWRWAGVPFYIRTGKRLAGRRRAHRGQLPPVAARHLQLAPMGGANRLVINLQPKDGLELHLLAQGQDNRQHARGSRRRCRRCNWTWTSTSASAPSASAPTNACCST